MDVFFTTLHTIQSTPSRNVKKQILINYLKTLNMVDLTIIMNILLNNYVTNVGPALINKFNLTQTSLFPESISIVSFHESLLNLNHSVSDNSSIITYLLANSSPDSRNYIKKVLLNNINIGISTTTILDALSEVLNTDAKTQYFIVHDISKIINRQYNGPELFNPVMSMLAKSLPINQYPEHYAIEYKYDGFRHQYHKSGDNWKIFSRKPEDISHKLYNIGEYYTNVFNHYNIDNVIIDGELISPNMKFQDAVKKNSKLIPIIFDILYINNTSLIHEPYHVRRSHLHTIQTTGIKVSETFDSSELHQMYSKALLSGYEGLMIKDINEPYIPNERRWIKMKKSTDSVDLVITGAVMGDGKRTNVYGSFILSGLYNDEISPICKVGTGFTDADLNKLYTILKPYECINSTTNEIYFENINIFVEIDYFEVTESPKYPCGKSLRFPVFKRIRTDKTIDTIQNLLNLK